MYTFSGSQGSEIFALNGFKKGHGNVCEILGLFFTALFNSSYIVHENQHGTKTLLATNREKDFVKTRRVILGSTTYYKGQEGHRYTENGNAFKWELSPKLKSSS